MPSGREKTLTTVEFDELTGRSRFLASGAVVNEPDSAVGVFRDMGMGRSTSIVIQSDSTGGDIGWSGVNGEATTGSWPALFVAKLAQKFPNHRIEWSQWDLNNTVYSAPKVLRAGAGERGFQCSASGGLRQIAYTDYGYVASDLDVRIKCSNAAFPIAASGVLIGQFAFVNGKHGWKVSLRPMAGQNQLVFDYSLDGTNDLATASSVFTLPAGNTFWFRVVYDADNGASGRNISFYYSVDGATWTLINTATVAGAATLFQAPVNYELGSIGVDSGVFSGAIYKAEIRDGINGPLISPINIESWRAYNLATQSQLIGSPTLFVYCGAAGGQAITYFSTNLKQMMPPMTRGIAFVSTGHNESMQATTEKNVSDWLAAVKARIRYAPIFAMLQNPSIAPSTRVAHQQEFVPMLGQIADSIGIRTIDVFSAFVADPRGLAALINAVDGVHPVQAGQTLWCDTVYPVVQAKY